MPLTVGEVNAKLSATTQMAEVATQTAQSVTALQASLALAQAQARTAKAEMDGLAGTMASMGYTAQLTLTPELEKSAAKFADAQSKVAAAKGALADLSRTTEQDAVPAFEKASGGLANMGTMADRLVVRLGLLLAIRGTAQFIEGLFAQAHQLKALSDQYDISTSKLQTFKQAESELLVPLSASISAIDTMEKKIGEGSVGFIGAVNRLGVSYSSLKTMSPEQAFDTLAEAIAKTGDRFERAGQEAEVFGSDKIDPLIRKSKDLSGELNDHQVKALDSVATAWDRAGDAAHGYFSRVAADSVLAAQGKGSSGAPSPTAAPLAGAGLLAGGISGLLASTALGAVAGVGGGPIGLIIGALVGAGAGILGAHGAEATREEYLPTDAEMKSSLPTRTPLGFDRITNMLNRSTGTAPPGAFSPLDKSQLSDIEDLSKDLTRDVEARITIEREEAALQKDMFEKSLETAKLITKEFEKQIADLTKATDSAVLAEFNARNANLARRGLAPTGESLAQYNSPEAVAQRKLDALTRDNPNGVDASERQAQIYNELLDAQNADIDAIRAAENAMWGVSKAGAAGKDAQDGLTAAARTGAGAINAMTGALTGNKAVPPGFGISALGNVYDPREAKGRIDAYEDQLAASPGQYISPVGLMAGRIGMAPYPTSSWASAPQIHVSGVLDPRTIQELTEAVSKEMMRQAGPSLRWGAQ